MILVVALFVTTTENSNPLKVLTRLVAAVMYADNPDGTSSAEATTVPSENIENNASPMCVRFFINRNAA